MDPDPIPFFFQDAKKIFFFFIFFSYNLPTGTLSSFLKIFAKNFVLKFYFAALIQSAEHIYEKREVLEFLILSLLTVRKVLKIL